MPFNVGAAFVTMKADASQLKKDVRSAVNEVKRTFSTLGPALKTVGLAAGGAAVAGISAAIIKSTKDAINFQQTLIKFDTVFKGLESESAAWVENLREGFGLSRVDAMTMMSTMQDMLVPMGMAREEAGQMSHDMTKLSAQLAAWEGSSPAEVMLDLKAAMAGSNEVMSKYGVVLREATIQQKVLDMGLAENKNSITEADKAMAKYQLIMEGTADAQAAYNELSKTVPEQWRRMKSQLSDLSLTLGKLFLPYVEDAIAYVKEWVGWLTNTDEGKRAFQDFIKDVKYWVSVGLDAIKALMDAFKTLYGWMKTAVDYWRSNAPDWDAVKGPNFGKSAAEIEAESNPLTSESAKESRKILDKYKDDVEETAADINAIMDPKIRTNFTGYGSTEKPLTEKIEELKGEQLEYVKFVEGQKPVMTHDYSDAMNSLEDTAQAAEDFGEAAETTGEIIKWTDENVSHLNQTTNNFGAAARQAAASMGGWRNDFGNLSSDMERAQEILLMWTYSLKELRQQSAGMPGYELARRDLQQKIEIAQRQILEMKDRQEYMERLRRENPDLFGDSAGGNYSDGGAGGGGGVGGVGYIGFGEAGGGNSFGGGGSSQSGGRGMNRANFIIEVKPTFMTGDEQSLTRAAEQMYFKFRDLNQRYGTPIAEPV